MPSIYQKLIVCKVDNPNQTELFLKDLGRRVPGDIQLSTDGFEAYRTTVVRAIGKDLSFAQVVKLYANPRDGERGERRYSTTKCTGVRIHVRRGNPNRDLISTSHVERANLTNRLFNRRFTRLTLGFSKKIEYLRHSVALFAFAYNFIKIHKKHNQTPAQAANLTDHQWTFEELLTWKD